MEIRLRPDQRQVCRSGLLVFLVLTNSIVVLAEPPPGTSTELYDFRHDSWSAGPSLLQPRYAQTATILGDGRVLVAGGVSDSGPIASAEIYDSTVGRWQAVAPMHESRAWHTATLLANSQVLVVGGLTLHAGQDASLASAELYNPSSNTWTEVPKLFDARSNHIASLLKDGRVLVAGGYQLTAPGSNQTLQTVELFDPKTSAWMRGKRMSYPRGAATATVLPGGEVLIVGGTDGPSPAEIYRPKRDDWQLTSPMKFPHIFHTTTVLPDMKHLLVVGGVSAARAVELLDLSSNRWEQLASTSDARDHHNAVLLPSGKVLVVGGELGLASAEIYDPVSRKWTSASQMAFIRSRATAVLLPSGLVMVIGGAIAGAGITQPRHRSTAPGIQDWLGLLAATMLILLLIRPVVRWLKRS